MRVVFGHISGLQKRRVDILNVRLEILIGWGSEVTAITLKHLHDRGLPSHIRDLWQKAQRNVLRKVGNAQPKSMGLKSFLEKILVSADFAY